MHGHDIVLYAPNITGYTWAACLWLVESPHSPAEMAKCATTRVQSRTSIPRLSKQTRPGQLAKRILLYDCIITVSYTHLTLPTKA